MLLIGETSAHAPRWTVAVALLALASPPARAQPVPDIMVVLDRAGEYATDYGASFRPVIMDEVYTPDLGRRPFDAIRCHATYSDYVTAAVQTEELGVRLPPETGEE